MDKERKSFKGQQDVKTVRDESNGDFKFASLLIRVLAINMLAGETSTGKKKAQATIADATGHMVMQFSEKHAKIMEKAKEKGNTLRVTDFMVQRGVCYITDFSTALRTHDKINIPAAILAQAQTVQNSTVASAKASPKKSRVNLKGKVVKNTPLKQTTVRRTQKTTQLLTVQLKDTTGIIPVSFWGETAVKLQNIKKNDVIQICRGEVGEFQGQPVINTWQDSTSIEIINETMDDVSDTEDSSTFKPKSTVRAVWESVGSITTYSACPNPKCFFKKLSDNGQCPSCKSVHTETTKESAIIATIGLEIGGYMKTVKLFTKVLREVYEKALPNMPLPQEEDDIEDALFDIVPLEVDVAFKENGIVTYMAPAV